MEGCFCYSKGRSYEHLSIYHLIKDLLRPSELSTKPGQMTDEGQVPETSLNGRVEYVYRWKSRTRKDSVEKRVPADEDNSVDLLSKLEKLYTNMRNISEKKNKACQQPSTPSPPTEPHGLPKCQRPLPNSKR